MEETKDSALTEIDLDSIVRKRAGKWGKYVPQWLINWLKRLIHQDYINGYLRQGLEGVPFCKGVLDYLGVEVEVEGRENLPTEGWHTFVSNHPLGAIDGVTLGWVLGENYDGHIRYLVNDLLMNLRGLALLCVPINKLGRQARNLPQMVETAFSGQNHVIMFPAGLCSRRQADGSIRDLPWNKTFVTKSIQHGRDIVPVHFVGTNSNRFYNVAQWCKRLHLPNFAMLLLPDEMYRSRGKRYIVKIGKPIPCAQFDESRTPSEWGRWVQNKVYEL